MLAALLFGAALTVSGICAFKDDIVTKADSRRVDDKGNVSYYDRRGNRYINGERIRRTYFVDENGKTHFVEKGADTGKIYRDKYQEVVNYYDKENAERKKEAIEFGFSGYLAYVKEFDYAQLGFTEISTGKIIACLFSWKDEYRKFYWNHKGISTKETDMGDYGIKITKKEYDDLMANTNGLVACLPSDRKVYRYYMDKDRNTNV